MKDLITAAASIMLLLVFLLQFSANQVLHMRMFQAEMAVASFREELREDGCISAAAGNRLQEALSQAAGCARGEITVSGTEVPAAKGSLIHYQVSYPLKNIIAAGGFLGISEEENRVQHEEEGWVVSRLEEPDYNGGNPDAADDGNGI